MRDNSESGWGWAGNVASGLLNGADLHGIVQVAGWLLTGADLSGIVQVARQGISVTWLLILIGTVVVAGVAALFVWANSRSLFGSQSAGCGAEREMERLMKLSPSTARKDLGEAPDGAWHAGRCVTAAQWRKSYHSRMLFKEGSPGAPTCDWLIEFAKPANFRVQQFVGDEGDIWATIGEQHFEWLFYQITGGKASEAATREDGTNRFLTIEKWLGLFRTSDPAVAGIYRDHGRRYVLLDYQSRSSTGVLLGEMASGTEVSGYRESVQAWIDAESGLLAKGQLEATWLNPAGEEQRVQLQQVFAGYDHDIQFDSAAPFGYQNVPR